MTGRPKRSEAFELKAGDIIYSGTPENIGPVVKGGVLLCRIQTLTGSVDQDRLSIICGGSIYPQARSSNQIKPA